MDLLRAAITGGLRVHPRLQQQGLGESRESRERLAEALPPLVPFGGRRPLAVVPILDWDHRLPTRQLLLRVHVAYDAEAADSLEAAFNDRDRDIRLRDLFPEFDVPDYEELPGDEIYEAELTLSFGLQTMRLTSAWRREIDPDLAESAVQRVRTSDEFRRVRKTEPLRSSHLGDLEPVSWMPPCESNLAVWTVDVWWLTAFDGRIGRGWSFLVDTETDRVLSHREFSVRAS